MSEVQETPGARSLWDVLSALPDHRRAEGKRYPLASLLLIAIAAMLAGRRDQLGIVRWGRKLSTETLAAIGIKRPRVPGPSVWCELFRDLDVMALERGLGAWVRGGAARAMWRSTANICVAARRSHRLACICWPRSVPAWKA